MRDGEKGIEFAICRSTGLKARDQETTDLELFFFFDLKGVLLYFPY